ncbi:redoxin domain-containing protein [Thermomicrobium sp. 4228-Ro]|nr:redoxin domain-containing protein [Thermomicrobium sp. 4228-Ro]
MWGRIEEIRALGAEVYAISCDSHFAQAAWARELGVGFPFLSDWNRDVIAAYDVKLDELAGYREVPARALVVVDRDGTIVHRDRAPLRELPDVEAAVAALRSLAARS